MIDQSTTPANTDAIRSAAIQCVGELGRGVAILEQEIVHGAPASNVAATLHHLRVLVEVVGNVMHADGRPLQ